MDFNAFDKIFITDLCLETSIGIHEHEKNQKQPILINLEAYIEPDQYKHDDYKQAVCYEALAKNVRDICSIDHIHLVENLAESIAESCLKDKRIKHIRVKIEKLGVLEGTSSVGVEIIRSHA